MTRRLGISTIALMILIVAAFGRRVADWPRRTEVSLSNSAALRATP